MKKQSAEDDDNYSDDENVESPSSEELSQLFEKANAILSAKDQVDEESFKFFAQLPTDVLTSLIGKLSKERSEKLMSYLSKTQDHPSKALPKKSDDSVFKRPQSKLAKPAQKPQQSNFFNPSAPVWSDSLPLSSGSQPSSVGQETERKAREEGVNILNQLLLRHEETENTKAGKDSSYLYKKKNRKFRLDPSEYGFEELSRFHECPAESVTCFPFYSVVARIMYSSGDHLKGDQRAIEMMHSQIEEMLKVLFDRKLISKLIRLAKPNSQHLLFELDDEATFQASAFIFPKSSKPVKKCFNLYFQTIFSEQYRVYQQFRETYQGIKEEGTFFKHNGGQAKTNDSDETPIPENEQDSDAEMDVEVEEDDNKEDHQLREMKDHFDREDDDDNNDDGDQSKMHNSNGKSAENSKDSTQKKKKTKQIFYDMNNDEDEDEDEVIDSEEARESRDTLEQIEKISNLEEDGKQSVVMKDSVGINGSNSSTANLGILKSENDSTSHLNLEQQLEDRIRFNKHRTDEMENSEWNYFMHIRSMTFSSGGNKKAFIEFLNVNRMNLAFQDTLQVFLPFIGYCLCKTIGIVVESILRERNQGKLQCADAPITEREVQQFGNVVIEKYISRAKKYVLSKDKLIKLAFSQFSSEFYECGYDRILKVDKSFDISSNTVPVTLNNIGVKSAQTRTRSSKVQSNQKGGEESAQQQPKTDVNLRDQWKSLKIAYKKMWVERIIAEGQVKRIIDEKLLQDPNPRTAIQTLLRLDSSQVSFINKYSSYLYERALEDLQKGQKTIEFAQHFKNWFLNNDSQRTGTIKKALILTKPQETRDTRRKQIKFESILN